LPIECGLQDQIGIVDDHAGAVDILLDARAVKPLLPGIAAALVN
jgi:hypothetical protein